MNESDCTVSMLSWSITSSTGEQLSTTLPKVARTFEDFAKCDVYTGDIDPTYWAMNRAAREYGTGWATRFCVGMLTYYHMGTAAEAAEYEGKAFWEQLQRVFPTAPRASERRHFRAAAGWEALLAMEKLSPDPVNFFQAFPQTYRGVVSVCSNRLPQFGPYFQLKICDYMDRCLGIPIRDMFGLERNLPSFPAKAVELLQSGMTIPAGFMKAVERVRALNLKAPPSFDRDIGPAEVETILCDWKRAKTGSSWLGADVLDKYEAMGNHEMRDWLPPRVARGTFKLELE